MRMMHAAMTALSTPHQSSSPALLIMVVARMELPMLVPTVAVVVTAEVVAVANRRAARNESVTKRRQNTHVS